MWGTWSLSFLISGIVFWLPFTVWPNLFAGRPATPEITTLVFWWIALMVISLFFSVREITKNGKAQFQWSLVSPLHHCFGSLSHS